MKNLLLSSLKLSKLDVQDKYIYCFSSESFPDYNFFILPDDLDKVVNKYNNATADTSNLENYLYQCTGTSNKTEFETYIFSAFSDINDAVLKMTLIPKDVFSTNWIPIDMTTPTPEVRREVGSIEPNRRESDVALMSLAEYDAVVKYLKSVTEEDIALRRNIQTACLLAMKDLADTQSNVVDIMYDNLLVSLQMVKNVDPRNARKFLSKMMKSYIDISEGV